ncbi:MAG: YbhN family protein [Acidimicrobiia bacterium]
MTTGDSAASETAPPPEKSSKTKTIVGGIITLIVLVLVFGIVLPQFGDYDQAWAAIQAMSAVALGILFLMTIFNIIAYVWPYQAALPTLKYRPAFLIRQTSFMISNVIPMGGAFGIAVQYGMLSFYGIGPGEATAGIGIVSAWNTFVTLSLPIFAAVGLVLIGQAEGVAFAVAAIGLVAVVAVVLLVAAILRSPETARKVGEWGDRAVAWAYGLFKKTPTFSVVDEVLKFRNSTVDVVSQGWLRITGTSYLQQFMQFLILWAAIFAIQGGSNAPVTCLEAFAAFAFGRLTTFIPLPPGGLGTTDAAITGILVGFGAANNDALAAVMVWRALTYFPQVIIGIGTYLYYKSQAGRQAKAEASPA